MLSPPPDLSQSATSFIASCRQGIHQTPFSRLIRSGGRRALLRGDLRPRPASIWLRSRKSSTRTRPSAEARVLVEIGHPRRGRVRPLGQCLQTWKDCLRRPCGPAVPHSERTRRRLVYCSLNDVTAGHATRDRCVGSCDPTARRIPRMRPAVRSSARGGGVGRRLVEPAGIEPATSCLQSTRSPG
jgi:hypothetical protein